MSESAPTQHSARSAQRCEELMYVEAPPEVVFRFVADLAQYARYASSCVRYGPALTATTDQPGARIELQVRRIGPFWQRRVLQLHAVEPPRCAIVGPPEGGAGLLRWTLEPEPPGTVVTLSSDLPAPAGPLGGALQRWAAARLAVAHRDALLRLKALAERENPVRP